MNELQIFNNEEFGEIRTITKDGEPWFVASDIAKALGYRMASDMTRRIDEEDKGYTKVRTPGGEQEMSIINESGLYAGVFCSSLDSAKSFKHWVTSEVLPSIRKTGSYGKPMSTGEQIQLLAQGNVELNQRVDNVENKIQSLEDDMPLYGCEIDEIQKHIRRKGISVLHGKDSPAYKDGSVRSSVYADMYGQLKREYGCVSSYKSIKRKYIPDVHDFIDCYTVPRVLEEQINELIK